MIKVINGDLLQANVDIIGHQVNCQGVMGAGLAKQIRNKYPVVYNDYKIYCKNTDLNNLLGSCQLVKVSENKYVANLFGQIGYGREGKHTLESELFTALVSLRYQTRDMEAKVGLPYGIGCGLAGGEWGKVYDIIDKAFSNTTVYLYKL